MTSSKWLMVIASASVLAVGVAACGSDDESDGGSGAETCPGRSASTARAPLRPLTEAVAEQFEAENSGVKVTVGTSGTGGGFEKFCAGETDDLRRLPRDRARRGRSLREGRHRATRRSGSRPTP